MIRKILIAVFGLVVLIGILGGVKGLQFARMNEQNKNFVPPPATVTTAKVKAESWETRLTAVGSVEAVQGVTVAAELPGKIIRIAFEPGTLVQAGKLLVQQDTSSEEAQLPGAESAVALARINLDRARNLLAQKMVSQADRDAALATYRQAVATRDNLRAAIDKKAVRAPFAGRLGIRLVDLGQMLREGDPIVSLQSLDPVFVNFLLPQKELTQIEPGLSARVRADAIGDKVMTGTVTVISPEVDAATRNVRVQATVTNPEERLRPGMFVDVAVVLPALRTVLAVPATAVLYAPYSDSVFVVEEKTDEQQNALVVRQQFVRLGETRGDFVSVTAGLQEGETVVSTGVFKLRNGQPVVVDNTVVPDFQLDPKPPNN